MHRPTPTWMPSIRLYDWLRIDATVEPIDEDTTLTRAIAALIDEKVSGDTADHVVGATVAALGVSYLPRYAVTEELELGELHEVVLDDAEPVVLPTYALYGSRDHVAAKVKDFLRFFVERFNSGDYGNAEHARSPADAVSPQLNPVG